MTIGPLRRLAGAAGMIALAPTGYMLATGSLAPAEAAVRAIATLVIAIVVGRILDRSMHGLANAIDRHPRRRADDEGADVETSDGAAVTAG
jgi:hypothetical protein